MYIAQINEGESVWFVKLLTDDPDKTRDELIDIFASDIHSGRADRWEYDNIDTITLFKVVKIVEMLVEEEAWLRDLHTKIEMIPLEKEWEEYKRLKAKFEIEVENPDENP